MRGLAQDVWRFVVAHYRENGSATGKNSRFVKHYEGLARTIATDCRLEDDAVLPAFLELVELMVTLLHRWDDLIDEKRWDIRTARRFVYNRFALKRIRQLQAACGLSGWKGLKRGLDRVERYFRMEARAKARKRVPNLDRALWSGNCDFRLYDDAFVAFIRQFRNPRANWLVGQVMCWRRGYLPLDLALDNAADLWGDLKRGEYNLLRWQCCERWVYMVQFGVVEKLFAAGEKHLPEARGALQRIRGATCHATWKLLNDYLEGEVEALKFLRQHDYFVGLPEDIRQGLLRIILKPFPWERLTLEEVGQWLAENLPNGRDRHWRHA